MKKQLARVAIFGILLSATIGIAPASAASCPKGMYKNSTGKCTNSPTKAPSWPAGASAKCFDGTFSFSASRRGTCSHHGGVSQWK
jgi:hypothetical protein